MANLKSSLQQLITCNLILQSMQREPSPIVRHGGLPDKRYISKPEAEQPVKPSVLASTTGAQMNPLPTATKAIPVPPTSSPRQIHAQPSISRPPSTAQSLPSVHPHTDRQPSHPMAPGTLSANAPEFKSIQDLCFDAASLGIPESGSRVSIVEYDGDCNSSTSEHSSGPPLEVTPNSATEVAQDCMCATVTLLDLTVAIRLPDFTCGMHVLQGFAVSSELPGVRASQHLCKLIVCDRQRPCCDHVALD